MYLVLKCNRWVFILFKDMRGSYDSLHNLNRHIGPVGNLNTKISSMRAKCIIQRIYYPIDISLGGWVTYTYICNKYAFIKNVTSKMSIHTYMSHIHVGLPGLVYCIRRAT